MKKVILLVLVMPYMAFGQILENFESGSLSGWIQSADNHWKADTTVSFSGRYSLHHCYDNPDAGSDCIGLRIKDLHPSEGLVRWSFIVRHGYDPSSSNNWAVFLMSDRDPSSISPDGNTNGFALGVNISGSDDTLRLVKVEGKILTTVVNCRINWQASVGINDAIKIIAERSSEGNWSVSAFRLNGTLVGTAYGSDKKIYSLGWFGIYYKYSSSRDRLLWIDEIKIEGTFYEDNKPPVISGCNPSGKNSVEIVFNEPPADEFLIPENFSLSDGKNKTVSVNMKRALTYEIRFSNALINKAVNNLKINKICDNSTNCSVNISIPFTPVWAETGDVVISEIMSDPLPEVSLPGKEYLEITNRTNYSFNMKNWKLLAGNKVISLPDGTISPNEIIILSSPANSSFFSKFGKVTEVYQFPVLTDDGMILCLADSSGQLIHGLEYTSAWYGDELKAQGGWSLEMKDTKFPFLYEENWTASTSRKGGTPGSVNSVTTSNSDDSFYGITNVFPADSNNIIVRFSEPVLNFPDKLNNIKIEGIKISDIFPTDPIYREFSLKLADQLLHREIYQLDISSDLQDFAGNRIGKNRFSFGLPESPEPGDIMFNELMFNPLPGDPDYLELYNKSGKVIDASRLQIVSVSDLTNDVSQIIPVSVERRCVLPDCYHAITTNNKKIAERYFSTNPDNLFQLSSLPSMNDDKGHMILYNRELEKIDEVSYDEKMHFSLLQGYEGVALEKNSPRSISNDVSNWHSASESSGWGTPGAPNSVFIEMTENPDKLLFSSTKITPNNDGFEDILEIKLNLQGNGNIISVAVFDETGSYVRKIASNLYAGTEATILWDGTADDGTPVNPGIYIIFITLYDDTGKTKSWKKVCSVLR